MARPSTVKTTRWITPVAFVAVVGIGALQLLLPIGWALAGLYMAPVALVSLWSTFRHSFSVVAIALLSTVFATFVFLSSPFWDDGLTALTDYLLPLAVMWFITILAVLRKWRERTVKRAQQDRLICTMCVQVYSEGGRWSLAEYGRAHLGAIIPLGLCGSCADKWGMADSHHLQMGA